MKMYNVYFFNTPFCISMVLDVNTTVENVICQIIENCLVDQRFDVSKLRYPEYPEGIVV